MIICWEGNFEKQNAPPYIAVVTSGLKTV